MSACSSSCHLSWQFAPLSYLFTSTDVYSKKAKEDFQRNSKSGQTVFTPSWDRQSTLLQVGTSHNSGYEKAARLQRLTNFHFKFGITKFPSPSSNSSGFCHGWEQTAKPDRLMVHPAWRFLFSSGLTLVFCSKRRAPKQRTSQKNTICVQWHHTASMNCENHHQRKH